MRKILGGVFVLLSLFTLGLAQESEYSSILNDFTAISEVSHLWNTKCATKTNDEDCDKAEALIIQEYTKLIERIKVYTTEGSDCSAAMRMKVLQHVSHVCQWNLRCAGKKPTMACLETSEIIKTDEIKLKAEMDACRDQLTPKIKI
jgi:hypothetical protein